jgi:hypothetical protein
MPRIDGGYGLENVGIAPVGGGGYQRVGTRAADFGGVEAAALVDGGEAVQRTGLAAVNLAQQRMEQRDALDVMNAMNAAEMAVGEYLRGVQGKKEIDARGVGDATSAWLDKYGEQAMKGLNPRAHAAFKAKFAGTVNDALNRASAHEAAEWEAEKRGLVRRTKTTQLNRVAQNYGDELARRRAVLDYENALLQGVENADERKALRDEFVSEAHLQVVDRLAVDDAAAALDYFNAHQDEIAGVEHAGTLGPLRADVARIHKALEERATKAAPARLAEQALEAGGDFETQADWIRAQVGDDYETADRAVDQLRRRYEESERSEGYARKRVLDDARGSVLGEIDAATKEGRPVRGLDAIVPLSAQAELAGTEGWASLQNFYEKRAKGEEPEGNMGMYSTLRNMAIGIDSTAPFEAANPERVREFRDMDLVAVHMDGLLNKAQLKELTDLQIGLREGKTTEKEKRSIRSIESVLTNLLSGVESQEQRGLIAQRFYDAVEGYKDRNDGQDPDEAELTRISTGLMFNPPEKNIPQYSVDKTDVNSALMRMPEIEGKALPADVFGTMGRALRAAGKRGSADEVKALAEAIASAGKDPGVPYTERQYRDMIAAMGK